MGMTLKEVMNRLPPDERRKIDARARDLIAEELSLQDLRKAMGKTQVQLARKLGVGQDAISRVEQRTDMLLSTLGDYVRGMGGELALVAEFPDRPPVRLTGIESIARTAARKSTDSRIRAAARKRR